MRVLLDGRYLQDHFPGIGRYTAHLVQALPEVPGVRELFVLRDPAAPNRRFEWADLSRTGARVLDRRAAIFSPRDQVTFNLQARRVNPDVIHFPYPVRPFAVPWPAVVTIHDTIPLRHPDLLPSWRDRLLFPLLIRLAAASARVVLTVSASARSDLIERAGIPAAKIRVAPNCVDLPPDAGRPRPGPTEAYLLYVGINKPHKNLPRLIEAYAASRVRLPLILAGPVDPRYPEARHAAERLGIAERVRWLGLVGEAELAALYRQATALVFPSLEEGFGLPVLEALAAGLPVIASDIPPVREVAAGVARLVDPRDTAAWSAAIAGLVADRAECERLVAAGRERAAHYSPRHTAELVAAAYQAALET